MKSFTCFFVFANFAFLTLCSSELSDPLPRICGWITEQPNSTEKDVRGNLTLYKSKGIGCVNYWAELRNYPRVAKIAKQLGLKFYAWLPAMLGTGPNKKWLFENHPEAYVITRNGTHSHKTPVYGVNHYKFLCPNRPIVRNYLKEMYDNVSRIPEVDGINLDYIRFIEVNLRKYSPGGDTCYCDYCVSDFKHKTGINISQHKHPNKVKAWENYRIKIITSLVNEIAKIVHANGKTISADVYPGPTQSTKHTRQKWQDWKLDMVFPMIYTEVFRKKVDWIGQRTKEAAQSLKLQKNGKKPTLYVGLQGETMNDKNFKKGVDLAFENGAYGISVFKLTNINEEKFEIMRNETKKYLRKQSKKHGKT